MRRYIPVVAALAAVLFTGLVHGFWTGRWETTARAAETLARVEQAGLDLPDWEGRAEDLEDRYKDPLSTSLYRRYLHRGNGREVTMLLVGGRPGPVSVHTPDVCYGASGYQVSRPEKVEVPGLPGTFWMAQMVKKKASEETRLRVFWSWNAGRGWTASDNPRFAFASFAPQAALFKLYLVRELVQGDEPLKDDPCLQLLPQLLPELQKSLFPGS
jgi:hypothetical protein